MRHDRWDFDTALLYYGEDNERVRSLSASVLARRDFDDDRYLDLGLNVDSLTGASPSGAIATDEPQTFTDHPATTCTRPRPARYRSTIRSSTRAMRANVGLDPALRSALYPDGGAQLLHGVRLHAPGRQPRCDSRLQPSQHDRECRGGLGAGRHRPGRRRTVAARPDAGRRRPLEQGGYRQQGRPRPAARRHPGDWSVDACCASTTPSATRAAI